MTISSSNTRQARRHEARTRRSALGATLVLSCCWHTACGTSDDTQGAEGPGETPTGGSTAVGGASATGGGAASATSTAVGGNGAGGAAAAGAGAEATGGAASGGTTSGGTTSGGAATGGAATGGTAAGGAATGGATTGGTTTGGTATGGATTGGTATGGAATGGATTGGTTTGGAATGGAATGGAATGGAATGGAATGGATTGGTAAGGAATGGATTGGTTTGGAATGGATTGGAASGGAATGGAASGGAATGGAASGGAPTGSGGAAQTCSGSDWTPGNQTITLMHDGIERSYDIHVPSSYTGSAAVPLMLVIHGAHNTPGMARSWSRMDAVSDANGFIIAYPAGLDCWNAGMILPGCTAADDDFGFLLSVVDDVESHACIDQKRVYASGISNGSMMAQYLGCEAADVFASIAGVAAGFGRCSPSRPISVFYVHGTEDSIVGYSPNAVDGWISANNCSSPPIESYNAGVTTCALSQGCDEGVEVEFCTVQGMDHCWPDNCYQGDYGEIFEASPRIWEFFARHPLP